MRPTRRCGRPWRDSATMPWWSSNSSRRCNKKRNHIMYYITPLFIHCLTPLLSQLYPIPIWLLTPPPGACVASLVCPAVPGCVGDNTTWCAGQVPLPTHFLLKNSNFIINNFVDPFPNGSDRFSVADMNHSFYQFSIDYSDTQGYWWVHLQLVESVTQGWLESSPGWRGLFE